VSFVKGAKLIVPATNEYGDAVSFREGYTVFNVEQVEGLREQYYAKVAPRLETVQRIDRAGSFFSATGAKIGHGGNQAFCTMADDRVQMPPFESFQDAESYYATLAHEVTHWTRHPKRLRDFGRKRWGDEGYLKIGAALSAAPGLSERYFVVFHGVIVPRWFRRGFCALFPLN
jgi:antirestriction protein ArdC